jgi:hypothetical protein
LPAGPNVPIGAPGFVYDEDRDINKMLAISSPQLGTALTVMPIGKPV